MIVVGTVTGETFPLDPAAQLGRGAEGVVYRVRGRRVAKVLKTPLLGTEAEKVTALAALSHKAPGFAWPLEPVRDPAGTVVGAVHPLAPGETLGALLDARATAAVPTREKAELALAVARAVAAAHALSGPTVVLGDMLKADNLMVDGTAATFVDTLTVTLFGFRLASGGSADSVSRLSTPGYVPREVLEHPLAKPSQTADRFALGVLLYELLFGKQPTEPRSCAAAVGLDPDQAVRDGLYFRYVAHPEFEAPTYDPVDVPAEVDGLFRAAFLSVADRPTAARWCEALERWLDDIRTAEAAAATKPDAKATAASQPPSRWAVVDRLAAVAALVVLIGAGVKWAADRSTPAHPPARVTPEPRPAPPLPSVTVGPPQFHETFK